MENEIRFDSSEILFLLGESGMVGIAKAGEDKMLFIETPDNDEIVQFGRDGHKGHFNIICRYFSHAFMPQG